MEIRSYTLVIEDMNENKLREFHVRVPCYTTAETDALRATARSYGTPPLCMENVTGMGWIRTSFGNYLGSDCLIDYASFAILQSPSANLDNSIAEQVIEQWPIMDENKNLYTYLINLPTVSGDTEDIEYRNFIWYLKTKPGFAQIKCCCCFELDKRNAERPRVILANFKGTLPSNLVKTRAGLPVFVIRPNIVGGALVNNFEIPSMAGVLLNADTQVVQALFEVQNAVPEGVVSTSSYSFRLSTQYDRYPYYAPDISSGDLLQVVNMYNNAAGASIISTDPYAPAGDSESGGGDGNFDFYSTNIPIPGLPNIGATDTGFISLYKPSAAQLKSLANYMWAGAFDITQFKKLFADPMDAILGLHIIPTTAAHPASGSSSLVIGNINTGLTMPTCTEQYYEADMGEISVPAKWGAYLDYSPYTKLSLYLPYIGFVPLSPDDCMRGSIKVVYHVDVLSGTCMAFVYCVSNRGQDGHTLYMFNGSCACDCPVTSGQYRSALEGLLGIAGSIGRVAAGDVAGGIKDAISNVTSMVKPEIGRSGSFGGSGGLMGIQYPYLVLTVPHMCVPGQQNTYVGYPSYVTKTIGDLSGFTSIDVSHLNNMTCTQAETEEIISLLSEGVIL